MKARALFRIRLYPAVRPSLLPLLDPSWHSAFAVGVPPQCNQRSGSGDNLKQVVFVDAVHGEGVVWLRWWRSVAVRVVGVRAVAVRAVAVRAVAVRVVTVRVVTVVAVVAVTTTTAAAAPSLPDDAQGLVKLRAFIKKTIHDIQSGGGTSLPLV